MTANLHRQRSRPIYDAAVTSLRAYARPTTTRYEHVNARKALMQAKHISYTSRKDAV